MRDVKARLVLRVTRPCTLTWAELPGGHNARDCGACNTTVHNLDSMTAAQIRGLVAANPGGFCGMYSGPVGEPLVVPAEQRCGPRGPMSAAAAVVLSASLAACSGDSSKAPSAGPREATSPAASSPTPAAAATPRPRLECPKLTDEEREQLMSVGYVSVSTER